MIAISVLHLANDEPHSCWFRSSRLVWLNSKNLGIEFALAEMLKAL